MYGYFPENHRDALRPYVKDQRVVDLGAGDCERTRVLSQLHPAALLAVDKEFPYEYPPPDALPFKRLPGAFIDVFKRVRDFRPTVAHLAWPINYPTPGLLNLLRLVPTVIYVGCNTDGSACGTSHLFKYLLNREVKLYMPDRRNTLIVYGCHRKVTRMPLPEERAGMDQRTILDFDPTVPDFL
jgi:hypothetical protein